MSKNAHYRMWPINPTGKRKGDFRNPNDPGRTPNLCLVSGCVTKKKVQRCSKCGLTYCPDCTAEHAAKCTEVLAG